MKVTRLPRSRAIGKISAGPVLGISVGVASLPDFLVVLEFESDFSIFVV